MLKNTSFQPTMWPYLAVEIEFLLSFYGEAEVFLKPRGRESTEVRISQNKGKESENSYQK